MCDILIVDDESSIRELLGDVLGLLGFPFREAQDGVEALENVAHAHPALIILDLMMPRMDGQTVLSYLKADPSTADIPVLVFTAGHVTEALYNALPVPPSMLLPKSSMSFEALRTAITGALGPSYRPGC